MFRNFTNNKIGFQNVNQGLVLDLAILFSKEASHSKTYLLSNLNRVVQDLGFKVAFLISLFSANHNSARKKMSIRTKTYSKIVFLHCE